MNLSSITLNGCLFVGNLATFSGVALFVNEGQAHTVKCKFYKNTVNSSYTAYRGTSEDFQKGSGGAIPLNSNGNVILEDCYFYKNSPDIFGETVFHSGNQLALSNALFETSAASEDETKQLETEIIFPLNNCRLENATFRHSSRSDVTRAILFHNTGTSKQEQLPLMNMKRNSTVNCSQGWKVTQRSDFLYVPCASSNRGFNTTMVTCLPCPRNTYNLRGGSISFSHIWKGHGFQIYQINCHPCPFGSRCHNDIIAPQDDFWGKTTLGKMRSSSCLAPAVIVAPTITVLHITAVRKAEKELYAVDARMEFQGVYSQQRVLTRNCADMGWGYGHLS